MVEGEDSVGFCQRGEAMQLCHKRRLKVLQFIIRLQAYNSWSLGACCRIIPSLAKMTQTAGSKQGCKQASGKYHVSVRCFL